MPYRCRCHFHVHYHCHCLGSTLDCRWKPSGSPESVWHCRTTMGGRLTPLLIEFSDLVVLLHDGVMRVPLVG